MSKVLINQYYINLERALQYGKSRNEQSIRDYFWILLNDYARKNNYEVIKEISVMGTKGKKVIPDGTVKNLWGLDIGYWESKDEKDDLNAEITAKTEKGYPLNNILFEDSQTAVLFQYGKEVKRVSVKEVDELDKILTEFMNFKSENVYKFEEAIEKFKADIPVIVKTLREKIIENGLNNDKYIKAQSIFLELCKAEINPDITTKDIHEMMIQHILTSDIFNKIFGDGSFHKHNTIAAELEKLISFLFSFGDLLNMLYNIEHYYQAIHSTAASITDHHEKQKFLKVLYENFYKVYNPLAADKLGVVYTPNEIVSFMVKSTDYLLYKHFGKTLSDKNIDILDPATGTGTFISEIIEHIPKDKLKNKYDNELFANEVAILPFYIANLNIEYTFKQKTGQYVEFKNLCFVDTLDNIGALKYKGKKTSLFGLTSENTERIKRQNSKKISVIIGNPPYNANQANENDNNKNREYEVVDKRIKDTFVKESNAQKTKVYDMYSRFYRWAMDRIDKNGMISFITNRSFIDSKSFDGFRKCIQTEFDYCYIIDLGGDIRALSGKDGIWLNEANTIFGWAAAVGIAMMFLIKKESPEKLNCRIEYIHPCDIRATRLEKFDFLKHNPIENIHFETIYPDKNNNWINLSEDNDWDNLIPLIDKDVKNNKSEANALFGFYSNGVATNRDEWVYDIDKNNLSYKMNYFINEYNQLLKNKNPEYKDNIKWSEHLKAVFNKKIIMKYDNKLVIKSSYRPFFSQYYYSEKLLSDRLTQNHYDMFGNNLTKENLLITTMGDSTGKPFFVLMIDKIADSNFVSPASGGTRCYPLYYYENDTEVENITAWGEKQFKERYKDDDSVITKQNIFYYVYAVLHNPEYKTKYELNLKREFPRIPFYNDFNKWVEYGKKLMDLHINYENQKEYELKRVDKKEDKPKNVLIQPENDAKPKKVAVKLKVDAERGFIFIDDETTLECVPKEAFEYKLGNRSAIEWICDQYKEKKYSDKTLETMQLPNPYKFADYKEYVIKLVKKVCTVSVETMNIIRDMGKHLL